MPFDATPGLRIADLSFSPGHEGLRRLALLLRQPPEDFEFHFSFLYSDSNRGLINKLGRVCFGVRSCGAAGCALGLAYHCWPEFRAEADRGILARSFGDAACKVFGLSHSTVDKLFYIGLSDRLEKKMSAVTPEDVAMAIDEYLAVH